MKVILTEKQYKRIILKEQLLWAAAILAYRQTAASKANRVTRHIKKNLRDRGITSRKIEGNLNQLMKCINGYIDEEGNPKGKKQINKGLVRKKAGTETFDAAFESFKQTFPAKVKICSSKFGLTPEESTTLSEVVLNTISDFAHKKIRL
jgi:SOS response regulatory protein OraA/RecX